MQQEAITSVGIATVNGVCHARIAGEMTICYAAQIKEELLPCLECGTEVEIDLSGVSEMDTAGFQLLLLAKRAAVSAGMPLRLVAHSAVTLEVLDLFNMVSFFGDPVIMPSRHNL